MTDAKNSPGTAKLLAMTAEIVGAHVANNAVEADAVTTLIGTVHTKLAELALGEPEAAATPQQPAVPIRKSITDDYLICLEDGRKMKILKRHLMTVYGLTPQDYRKKWRLAPDYPMIAPAYAARRKALALEIGLGRKLRAMPAAEAVAVPAATATPPKAEKTKSGRAKLATPKTISTEATAAAAPRKSRNTAKA